MKRSQLLRPGKATYQALGETSFERSAGRSMISPRFSRDAISPLRYVRIAPLKLLSIVIAATLLTLSTPFTAHAKVNQASLDSQDPQAGSSPQTQSAVVKSRPRLADAEGSSQLAVAPAATPNPNRTSWIPPDIDTVAPSVAAGVECPLPQVVSGVGQRMKEFVDTLEKFSATETVVHFKVDGAGWRGKPETRTFDYVVMVKAPQSRIFYLDEYRNGSLDPSQFPAGIATLGLPSMAMIFHPNFVSDFSLSCEGLGQWGGHPTWQIHFTQRADRPNRIRVYVIAHHDYPVPLKGRAWIDADTYQIRRLETDLLKPVQGPVALTHEHTAIDYGPVRLQTQKQELWVPQEAELYVDRKGHRYFRHLTYDNFKVFAVESSQKIQAPKESYCFQNTSNRDISGTLIVLPVSASSARAVSIQVTISSGGKVCKLVGLGLDVNMQSDEDDSATFATDGPAGSIIADATVVRASTSGVIP